jgi:hypothetical protein
MLMGLSITSNLESRLVYMMNLDFEEGKCESPIVAYSIYWSCAMGVVCWLFAAMSVPLRLMVPPEDKVWFNSPGACFTPRKWKKMEDPSLYTCRACAFLNQGKKVKLMSREGSLKPWCFEMGILLNVVYASLLELTWTCGVKASCL